MSVIISDIAAKRIAQILLSSPDKIGLRISVEGGGCSGFSYKYNLVSEKHEDDLVLKKGGAIVFIDSLSLPFMEGAEIDFVDDLMGQSFQIHNPNAVSSCGCGVSFSI
ncbi:iron-sulfur cluster assembly accessory protein [Bartonella alsatica]|uniref:Iron-sulfur cluster assembly accessory protein n=2 Tax=Bartonella alsatica TaxID=52764 RepID=J0PTG6_9HYPH|nr:iron-sulfur cluster assembly accessory protein [Bartonella alsatica]EJF75836.1 iron-sulfur cluster assembly accessory protein [Bartonella alsatica IBS 382]QLC51516.1 iron-sulfur cluster assembly accessory protein [Bartonella alsatica]